MSDVPDEIRERVAKALNAADCAGLPIIAEPGEMGTTLSYEIDWRHVADIALAVLDRDALIVMLGAPDGIGAAFAPWDGDSNDGMEYAVGVVLAEAPDPKFQAGETLAVYRFTAQEDRP